MNHLPVSKMEPRLFLPLNLMQRRTRMPREMKEPRTRPVHPFLCPFVDVDSIRYPLPAGYEVEAGSGDD